MLRVSTKYVQLGLVAACIASMVSACSSSEPTDLGNTQLSVTLPDGTELLSVDWEITGDALPSPRTGTIDVGDADDTVSAFIGGIPVGSGYTLKLSAVTSDGLACTSEDVGFDIPSAGATTSVSVTLNCGGDDSRNDGNLVIDGTIHVNTCPTVNLVVSPINVSVGNTMDLEAEAEDADGDDITFEWTASAGEIDDPDHDDAVYTCTLAGPVTLELKVGDSSGCNVVRKVDVTCRADGSGPDQDGDEIEDAIDNCPNVPNSKQGDTDRDGIGDACDGPNGSDGLTRGRLVVISSTLAEAYVVDLDTFEMWTLDTALVGDSDGEFDVLWGTGGISPYSWLVHAPAGPVEVVDVGARLVDHGDHFDLFKTDPSMHPFQMTSTEPDPAPIHVVAHDGKVAVFFDGLGETRIVSEAQLDAGEAEVVDVDIVTTNMPHHGVALVWQDHVIISVAEQVGERASPNGVAVYHPDDTSTPVHLNEDCTGLHGETSQDGYVAFGCENGVLIVRHDGTEFSSEVLPYPDGSEGRTGNVQSHPASPVVVGTFGTGFVSVNPVTRDVNIHASPADRTAYAFEDGQHLLVLGADGNLYRLSLDDFSVEDGPLSLVPAFGEEDSADIFVAANRLYVVDSRETSVVAVDLAAWEILDISIELPSLPSPFLINAISAVSPDWGDTGGALDSDGDGFPDSGDNCPDVPNDQADFDRDGVGDACDPIFYTAGHGDMAFEFHVDDGELEVLVEVEGATVDGVSDVEGELPLDLLHIVTDATFTRPDPDRGAFEPLCVAPGDELAWLPQGNADASASGVPFLGIANEAPAGVFVDDSLTLELVSVRSPAGDGSGHYSLWKDGFPPAFSMSTCDGIDATDATVLSPGHDHFNMGFGGDGVGIWDVTYRVSGELQSDGSTVAEEFTVHYDIR